MPDHKAQLTGANLTDYNAAEEYANNHSLEVDSIVDNMRVQSYLEAWTKKNAEDGLVDGIIETLQQYY